jgi:transposase
VLHDGVTQGEAAAAIGVRRQVVSRWMQRHRDIGAEGLLDGRRVSPRKGCGILTALEARRVQGWITDKCPDQMQLPFALWTAQAVRDLIHKNLGKTLGLSTMQLYLKRWGFTAQKPVTRATQRDPHKIATWLEQDYPSIAARATREGAAIYWSDKTGINNRDQIGRGYAPKGKTPVLTQTGRKFSMSMIAAVSKQSQPDAVQALRGRLERCDLHRFPEASRQGREAKSLLDRRQPARPSRQGRDGMARATQGRDRDFLSAGLCAGTQPGRISEQRPEADHQEQAARQNP